MVFRMFFHSFLGFLQRENKSVGGGSGLDKSFAIVIDKSFQCVE